MPSGYLLFDNKWIHSYIAKSRFLEFSKKWIVTNLGSGFLEFSSNVSLSGMMGVDFWARRDIITWIAKIVPILQIVYNVHVVHKFKENHM